MDDRYSFQRVIEHIVEFRDAREWAKFHTPRNLASALGIEVAELQELFLWMSDRETQGFLDEIENWQDAKREIGDILIFALLFCHELGIDPREAIYEKLTENELKYPVDLARGRATKYTRLGGEEE